VRFEEGTEANLENAAAITGVPLSRIDQDYGLCVIDVSRREYVFQALAGPDDVTEEHGPFANPGIATFE